MYKENTKVKGKKLTVLLGLTIITMNQKVIHNVCYIIALRMINT